MMVGGVSVLREWWEDDLGCRKENRAQTAEQSHESQMDIPGPEHFVAFLLLRGYLPF